MIFQIQLTWLCAAAVLLATEIQRCKQPQLQCNTRDLRFRLQKRVTKRFSNSQTCKAQNCRLTNSSPSCHVSMIANWKKRKAFQAHGLAHSFQQRSFRDTAPTATEWIHNCNIILYSINYIHIYSICIYCIILHYTVIQMVNILYNLMPGPSCLVLEAIAADRRRCVSRTDMATATGTQWDPSCEVLGLWDQPTPEENA